jgi:hypothetical protein
MVLTPTRASRVGDSTTWYTDTMVSEPDGLTIAAHLFEIERSVFGRALSVESGRPLPSEANERAERLRCYVGAEAGHLRHREKILIPSNPHAAGVTCPLIHAKSASCGNVKVRVTLGQEVVECTSGPAN